MPTSSSCVSCVARYVVDRVGIDRPRTYFSECGRPAGFVFRASCWRCELRVASQMLAGRDDGRGAARMPAIRHSRIESYLLKNGPFDLVEWPARSVRMCRLVVLLTGERVSIAACGESARKD
ncbi:hypothetical protein [Burkholderia pyrrocinia]|uniref:hypothetical protein n=1 Tax=Burkholderia pyrrocinia TaxID=60550 RepID=UPI002AAF7727|nr:hypothetical protein [Burkholderia pyrrocinia]